MKKVVLLLLLLAGAVVAQSQELNYEYTDVYVLDAMTSQPIEGVLAMVANRDVGESDSNGRLVFLRHVRNISPTLIFFKDGYALDSITLPYVPDTVYLKPLTGVLEEAVVTNKNVELLLKSGTEYVVDYEFLEDYILVASYSGSGGRHAKLFILDDFGDTLAMTKVAPILKSLYRSCVGKYYLVSYNTIYPIDINIAQKKITLGKPMPLRTLAMLQQCVLYRNNTYYYKFINRRMFRVMFAYGKQGDTAIVPFRKLEQEDVLYGSIEGQMQVQKLLAEGAFKEAAKLAGVMRLLDNNAIKQIDVPLYVKDDSLIIFEYDNHLIHYYSLDGYLLKQKKMAFDSSSVLRVSILQDVATKKFYLLNKRNKARDLYAIELPIANIVGNRIFLEKPFAEKIKLRDGNIYYLYQEDNGATKQLYVQRNSIK